MNLYNFVFRNWELYDKVFSSIWILFQRFVHFGSFPEKVGELSTNIVFSGKLLFFPVEI